MVIIDIYTYGVPERDKGWAGHAGLRLPVSSPCHGEQQGRWGEESLGLGDGGGSDAGDSPDTLFFPPFGAPPPVAPTVDTAITRLW